MKTHLGRVDHDAHGHLPHGVGAEVDGRNLIHLLHSAGVDVGHLDVAAAQAALAARALRRMSVTHTLLWAI